MCTLVFLDGKSFILTNEQMSLIPFFGQTCGQLHTSNPSNHKIVLPYVSTGFELINEFTKSNETLEINHEENHTHTINLCKHLKYHKLENLLKIPNDSNRNKNTQQIHRICKIKIEKKNYPIIQIVHNMYASTSYIDVIRIEPNYIDPLYMDIIKHGNYESAFSDSTYCSIHNSYNNASLARYYNKIHQKIYNGGAHNNGYVYPSAYTFTLTNETQFTTNTYGVDNLLKHKLYMIYPIYEYPESLLNHPETSENRINIEINEVHKKMFRQKCNIEFIKNIQKIISFNNYDIICTHNKETDIYKLLSDTKENEYIDIDCIVVDNEPKFNNNYFVKHNDDSLEIYEGI